MGLLDDAIRDHLELKRRRGADPSEVAREQQEALDAPPAEGQAWADDAAPASEETVEGDGQHAPVGAPADMDEQPTAAHELEPPPAAEDLGRTGQETAEIDMQSVLDDGDPASADSSGGAPDDWAAGGALEWDAPSREGGGQADEDSEVPRQIPGQERLSLE